MHRSRRPRGGAGRLGDRDRRGTGHGGGARAELADEGLTNAEVRVGDAATPGFAPARFDAVVAGLVMFMLPDPADAAARYRRLLRLGGRFAMTTFGADDPAFFHVTDAVVPYVDGGMPAVPGRTDNPLRSKEGSTACCATPASPARGSRTRRSTWSSPTRGSGGPGCGRRRAGWWPSGCPRSGSVRHGRRPRPGWRRSPPTADAWSCTGTSGTRTPPPADFEPVPKGIRHGRNQPADIAGPAAVRQRLRLHA
ncbi:methyltransferase domain-containing protein [Micromonospora sp. BRA006-A]|nr:methyltransferase domain-containing protein [Micromonospora sp. BRA006-A]